MLQPFEDNEHKEQVLRLIDLGLDMLMLFNFLKNRLKDDDYCNEDDIDGGNKVVGEGKTMLLV